MAPVDHYDPLVEEKKLWEHVLLRALRDLRSSAPRIRSEAREWIESERDTVGSFLWVCATIGIDPTDFRRRVL